MRKHFILLMLLVFVSSDLLALSAPDSTVIGVSGTSTRVQKRKVVFIDTANPVYPSFSAGCPANYAQIGVRHMPKNSAYYTKIAPISRSSYFTRFTDISDPLCILDSYTVWHPGWDPTWVTSFQTPELICAPISVVWN